MKENVLKTFWRDTYQSKSPIPFIISAQIIVFVLIHLFDLLYEVKLIQFPLYDNVVRLLSLPLSSADFIQQPWSILSYPFIHTGLFQIVFDCLWMYWMGTLFLNFLNNRQFLFLLASAVILGGFAYLALGQITFLQQNLQTSLTTPSVVLAALVAAVISLVPQMEVRLMLIGTLKLKTVGLVFLGLECIFLGLVNKPAAIVVILMAAWGYYYISRLKQGRDFSLWFKPKVKPKLKVVYANPQQTHSHYSKTDLPNQQEIDDILDKISVGGYENLTSQEKETLFKASKQE